MELNSLLPSILWLNSIILIGFILIQNESAKDSVTTSTSSSLMNPFEKFTWGSLILQFSLLLIKIKTNDF